MLFIMEKKVVVEKKQNFKDSTMCGENANLVESYTMCEIIKILNDLMNKDCSNYKRTPVYI